MIFIDLSRSWRCLLLALLCCASALNHCQQYSWKCVASLRFLKQNVCFKFWHQSISWPLCLFVKKFSEWRKPPGCIPHHDEYHIIKKEHGTGENWETIRGKIRDRPTWQKSYSMNKMLKLWLRGIGHYSSQGIFDTCVREAKKLSVVLFVW